MEEMVHNGRSEATERGGLFGEPFPSRGAVEVLRDRVILDLKRRAPKPGSPFMTDAELAARSGLSRSTIRRALGELQKDGWLSREVGRGTFVGPRVSQSDFEAAEASVGALRLGVVLFDIGDLSADWVTPQVMSGIDEEAASTGLSVELLGLREVDGSSLSKRLERSRPDVLVSLAARPRDALFLRDAIRLDIPTLVVGTAHQYLGLPAVVEDNRQGMNLAVDMLRDAGHERIGMLINRWPGAWVFERQEAFENRMIEDGLDPYEVDTCWIGAGDHPGHHDQWRHEPNLPHRRSLMGGVSVREPMPFDGGLERVCRWLERTQPTAVVAASYAGLDMIGAAARKLGLSIPGDLSVAGMDQHPKAAEWLGVEPSLAELPLRDMGRQVALTSRALSEGASLPGVVLVPFRTRRGASVAPRT
ncbi:MAG: substrate-binding domain-containing protein [Planctomycetota bacterium]